MKKRRLLISTLITFFSRSALTQSIVLSGTITTADNIVVPASSIVTLTATCQ